MNINEAEQKVCPFMSSNNVLNNCVCGNCMFWQWEEDCIPHTKSEILEMKESGLFYPSHTIKSKDRGFCNIIKK